MYESLKNRIAALEEEEVQEEEEHRRYGTCYNFILQAVRIFRTQVHPISSGGGT